MTRQESDREDLIAEATGLPDRVELQLDAQVLVAGFRRNSAVSLFFGQDEVYQFNVAQQLRRAYNALGLIKSQRGRLFLMQRQREASGTILNTRELSSAEVEDFLSGMSGRIDELRTALNSSSYRVLRSVSESGDDVVARLRAWANGLPETVGIAASPRVGDQR